MKMGKFKNLATLPFIFSLFFSQPAYTATPGVGLAGTIVGLGAILGVVWGVSGGGDDNGIERYEVGEAWPKETEGTTDQVGWVFYCNGPEPCAHGLIAAMNDVGGIGTTYEWGCIGITTGAVGTAIGTGKINTKTLMKDFYHAGLCDPVAARVCSEYNAGGYTDWFLPSSDELFAIHTVFLNNGISFADYNWSSTENDSDYAYAYDAAYGGIMAIVKNATYNVRPAREF